MKRMKRCNKHLHHPASNTVLVSTYTYFTAAALHPVAAFVVAVHLAIHGDHWSPCMAKVLPYMFWCPASVAAVVYKQGCTVTFLIIVFTAMEICSIAKPISCTHCLSS